MSNKFLIFIDILGFGALPKEIAEKTGIDENVIIESFLSEPLSKAIKSIEKLGMKLKKDVNIIKGTDDYVLMVDNDIDLLFEALYKLTTIKIPHKNYASIPIEIAIDKKPLEINVNNPINQSEVINFLKKDIITPYKASYRKKHGASIKETFILITEHAFSVLARHHKKGCEEYSNPGEPENKCFYYLPSNIVERENMMSGFLNKIGQSKSDFSGALIDQIFIKPDEYQEIKETLEKKRIVFLTGQPGYGKTYTAIKLLWEWYNKEYTPQWISGKDEIERKEVREFIANMDAVLKPKHIIYLEDPFGKTHYERRDDLKERINGVINTIKNKETAYVIITSRKDVFEKFNNESYSVEDIKAFEKELNILRPSYSYEKRSKILEEWAVEKGCLWLKDGQLRKIVFDLLKQDETLSTPLSIHDFVEATIHINEQNELKEKIIGYSKVPEKAFADEIKGLCDSGRIDRVLFLSFIFISENLEVVFVKKEYKDLKEEGFEDFSKILEEEYRAKIDKFYAKEVLKFSHPIYANALPYILCHSLCKEIFCKVLNKLCQIDSTAVDVARAVAANFDKLSAEVRNKLLITLSERDSAVETVAWVIAENFDKLPAEVRNKLLITLSEKDSIARDVARAIAANFDKLPVEVRNKLLITLSERDNVAGDVARAIADNFDKLPAEVRNKLLITLSEKDSVARDVARAIAANFDKLPAEVRNKLLITLSEKDSVARDVARAIAANFDKLPVKVRNKLLITLSERDNVAGTVALAIADNFDKLPAEVRNKLLTTLSERDNVAGYVAWVIAANFDKFPAEVRNKLLITLSEKDSAVETVALVITDNFEKLPVEVRNKLLITLSERNNVAGYVVGAIAENFDEHLSTFTLSPSLRIFLAKKIS